MGYRIASVTPQDVVLLRDRSTGNFRNLFVIIAAIFLVIGLTGIYFSRNSTGWTFLFFCVFTGVAAFLLAIGPVVARMRQAFDPLQFTFSNTKGILTVIQDKAAETTACIPYSDILLFGIREDRQQTSTDSTVSTRSNYKYIVYFQKKDGSIWELRETASQRDAITMLEQLQRDVHLQNPGTCPASKKLSDKLDARVSGSATGLTWRNNALRQFLLFIPAVILIGGVLAFFWYTINGPMSGGQRDWFPMVILGFICVVFAAVILFQGFKLVKDSRTVYEIQIGRTDFCYTEKSKSGSIRKEIIYKLGDIKGVLYNYRITRGESDIHILREAEMENHRRMMRGDISFSDLLGLMRSSMNELQLRITALNCTERLQLENWIQEAIARHTAKHTD